MKIEIELDSQTELALANDIVSNTHTLAARAAQIIEDYFSGDLDAEISEQLREEARQSKKDAAHANIVVYKLKRELADAKKLGYVPNSAPTKKARVRTK
jgi:hypothetical protein